MSLSHQSTFNSPAAGGTVPGYYSSYYNHYPDFYSAADHLDFTHHQSASHHTHGPYSGFPAAAASYGMLSALHQGGGAGGLWYEPAGSVEPIDTELSRFDVTGSTAGFRRLPVSTIVDVKPETAMRMTQSGTTGRSAGRGACRELSSDGDVSFPAILCSRHLVWHCKVSNSNFCDLLFIYCAAVTCNGRNSTLLLGLRKNYAQK